MQQILQKKTGPGDSALLQADEAFISGIKRYLHIYFWDQGPWVSAMRHLGMLEKEQLAQLKDAVFTDIIITSKHQRLFQWYM